MSDPGPVDHSLDGESRAWITIVVVTITLTIATTAVVCRFFTRTVLIQQLGYDDWVALVGLCFAIACGGTVATNLKYGLGRHAWTLSPDEITHYLRTFYVSIVMYNAGLMSIKLTFLAQYYRVLGVPRTKPVLQVATAVIGSWALSQLLIVIFTCTPVRKSWEPEIPGTCVPNLPFWYINAAGNIATDVGLFVLPLPMLNALNLRRRQKILLIFVFSLGFFTVAISFVRLEYLHQTADFTWQNTASSSWSVGELCSGITCACLPTLRPLLAKFIPHLHVDSRSGYSSKGYHQHTDSSTSPKPTTSHAETTTMRAETRDSERKGSADPFYSADLEATPIEKISDSGAESSSPMLELPVQGNVTPRTELQPPPAAAQRLGLRPPVHGDVVTPPPRDEAQSPTQAVQVLGLRPTVTTEVVAGSSHSEPGWPLPSGIEVKRDVVLTTDTPARRR